MIIFFVKETGEIVGVTSGRVHEESVLEHSFILPSGYVKDEIGKYVVPFKKVFRDQEEEVTELRIVDDVTKKVAPVVIGKRMISVPAGMVPDVKFSETITAIEEGKEDIYTYKIVTNENGEVIDLTKK